MSSVMSPDLSAPDKLAPDLLVLVISLPEARARRQALCAALQAEGIAYELLPSVDGRKLDLAHHPDIDLPGTRREMGREMLPGEYGCALSHVAAYRRFLASPASHLLVLEDDAEPRPELGEFLRRGCYRRHPMFLLHHRMAWAQKGSGESLFGQTRASPLANTPTMAAAYTLSRPAAARLLQRALPVRRVADWPIEIADLDCWLLLPMPVGHPPFSEAAVQSTIGVDRSYEFARPFHRLLSPGFFRRKWRRLGARKVS